MRWTGVLLALALVGCDDGSGSSGKGGSDAATDAGAPPSDAAVSALDAAGADALAPDASPHDAAALDGAPPADAAPLDAAPPPDAAADDAAVPAGDPFAAPDRTWTWIDVAGTTCDDGSSTGVGVNLVPGAPGVVVVLNGGGLCWDYQTCFVLNTAAHGPVGSPQFAAMAQGFAGTILDRDLAGNPFAAWSLVFVPYCTGDAHAGDRDASYTDAGGGAHLFRHRGRANLRGILPRLAATAPAGTPVAVVGLSVGGMGAVLDHGLFRQVLPGRPLAILDDSGPLLIGDAVPADLRQAFYASWGLDWLDAECPACRDDLGAVHDELAARFPDDRTALIDSQQDQVMRSFFRQDAGTFQAALGALVTHLDTLPGRHAFVRTGQGHVALGQPAAVQAVDGAPLLPWIAQWLTADPAWTTHGP
jgi:hypothetical protein